MILENLSDKLKNYNPVLNYFESWSDFSYEFEKAFFDAIIDSWQAFLRTSGQQLASKKIQTTIRATFDHSLRSNLSREGFVQSLAKYIDNSVKMAEFSKLNELYKGFLEAYAHYDNIIELIRDRVNRTPSEIIPMKGSFELHHYKSDHKPKFKTPLLIVGSLINRHYILDLLPEISVVKNLQRQGFDVYATDWRTPFKSKNMTISTFAHDFLENSVNKIREITGIKKVSLMGYCWGGIFSLIHASNHPENVKNLILHATPADLEKDTTVIEKWTKQVDVNNLVKVFGSIPPSYLNLAFVLRNPIEAFLKYPRYFSEPRTASEIKQFFNMETWLYDSPPVIGNVFKQIIEDIYKKNLLIKNKMKLGGKTINLRKIAMPVLNIIGSSDDLVPPQSSKPILDVVSSKDKHQIEFPTGHVGLCISTEAHEKLWPKVGRWLGNRS